jgi:hypothetical protein
MEAKSGVTLRQEWGKERVVLREREEEGVSHAKGNGPYREQNC